MKGIIRLTCAVNRVKAADPAACLDEILRVLEDAGEADITVFPKLALCSASCGGLYRNRMLHDACDSALDRLCELSAGRAGYIIVGTAGGAAVLHRGETVALVTGQDSRAVFSCGDLRFCILDCDPCEL
ncbi:MAG: hypothetical protein FWH00_03215, partial [Oscillospiraceae bacterium]|nr:hypothetical protein [Oscillospiraceae bacterium]